MSQNYMYRPQGDHYGTFDAFLCIQCIRLQSDAIGYSPSLHLVESATRPTRHLDSLWTICQWTTTGAYTRRKITSPPARQCERAPFGTLIRLYIEDVWRAASQLMNETQLRVLGIGHYAADVHLVCILADWNFLVSSVRWSNRGQRTPTRGLRSQPQWYPFQCCSAAYGHINLNASACPEERLTTGRHDAKDAFQSLMLTRMWTSASYPESHYG